MTKTRRTNYAIETASWPGPEHDKGRVKGPGGQLAYAAIQENGGAVRIAMEETFSNDSVRRVAQEYARSHGFFLATSAPGDGYLYARITGVRKRRGEQ